ncbi:MAG: protein translocase subunit SecF [Patescibacteria group bacterium]
MYKIIRNSKIWFILSGLLAVVGAAALIVFGLRIGIDYRGGTIMEIQSINSNRVEITTKSLQEMGYSGFQVKPSGTDGVSIKLGSISNDEHLKILSTLTTNLGDAKEISYNNVGPTIGKDLTTRSIYAIIMASIGIIIYIAYAFRKLPKPLSSWKFGVSAVIALAHDLLITIGLFALIGHFYYWMEVDVLFITALLTIMGFSVHDTIVVYDRLRENFIKNPRQDIAVTTEESVNQTLARSISTSMTVVLVLLSLLILGSISIRHFILTLTIGIIIGTYSSIFVASPLVVVWHKKLQKSDR